MKEWSIEISSIQCEIFLNIFNQAIHVDIRSPAKEGKIVRNREFRRGDGRINNSLTETSDGGKLFEEPRCHKAENDTNVGERKHEVFM